MSTTPEISSGKETDGNDKSVWHVVLGTDKIGHLIRAVNYGKIQLGIQAMDVQNSWYLTNN